MNTIFRVHAGANPSAIRLEFDGSARPSLSPEGDLLVGELLQHRPVAYQNAPNGRVPVDCRYVIRQSGEVALALGAYDRNRELIIDPVLSYASYMGGTLNDGVTSIKVDAAGSVYMTGFTASSNFPAKGGSQNSYGGSNSEQRQGQFGDAFVAKLNPAGTAVVYATYLGGSGEDLATSIAIDSAGNAYVAGSTQSANFPVSASAPQRVYRGFTNDNGFYNPGDGFAVKLNAAGNQLVYATYLGGGLNDLAMGIAVDNGGNAVVVGATTSSDFPTTAGAAVRVYRGANNTGPNFGPSIAGDGFITIINAAGSAFNYSTFFGGAGRDGVSCVALDAQNNIYVGGLTLSSDFPVTPGAFQSTFKGVPTITNGATTVPGDGFVAKFDFGGKVPAQPARINVVAGFSGAGTVSARLATPFTVEVLDAAGAGVANAVVTFAATGASVSPASATTDAQGRASTTVTLGATAGSGSVTATVAGLPVATAALTISPAAQGPVVSAVVNGASFLPALAGGSWITAYVNVTAAANATATTVPLPTTLGGFRILVNGTPIPMYLVFALSPGTQLNAQLPYGLVSGTAQVIVEQNGVPSAAFPITVQPSAPGIFVFGNNRAVAQNVAPDGSVSVNTADNGVPAGDYIIAYFTGQGALNNPVPTGGLASGSPLSIPTLPYSATLDGAPVPIAFLGMTPGQIALGQANIQIPRETKPGTYPLVIRIGDTSSNGPLLTVNAPRP